MWRWLVGVLVCASSWSVAQTCVTDGDCDAGVCFQLPGCDAGATRLCVASGLVAPGSYCGCDGQLFTRKAEGRGDPFRAWQHQGFCGLDAGLPPISWRERSWASRYDDAGIALEPEIAAAEVQPRVRGNGLVCEGGTATLVPPASQSFPARGKHRVYLGCGEELPVVSWAAKSIVVRVPRATQSGCVSLALPASEEDAALHRHAFSSFGANEKFSLRSATPVTRAGNGAKCLTTCVSGADGGVLNRLEVGQLPELGLSTMANAGRAAQLADGGLRLFVEGEGFMRWSAGDAGVKLSTNGTFTPRAGFGEEPLRRIGPVRLQATNRCGTVERSVEVIDRPALEHPARLGLRPGRTTVLTVTLPKPAESDTTLQVRAPAGVTAPAQVSVVRGQTTVRVEVGLSRDKAPKTKALGNLQLTAPEGYSGATAITLERAEAPKGFADLHVHQFSNYGFGGVALVGRSDGALASSLGVCSSIHGPGGIADVAGSMVRMGVPGTTFWGHSTDGWSDYDGWPDALDYSHQQVHHEALKRAWQGGLRLMVMLALNNKEACKSSPDLTGTKTSCEDMDTVWKQLDAAKQFEANDGRGWYHIVRSAKEARETIAAGQLAVVLGTELDTLGSCVANSNVGKQCNPADVTKLVNDLADAGVRHVFPIHFVTNGFGGSALSNPMTHTADGDQREGCSDYTYNPAGFGGVCNPRGLDPLGEQLISELMAKKMIIDIDHQSKKSRTRTLELAVAAQYPVVAGHAWFYGLMKGNAKHEGVLLDQQLKTIRQLGGMVGLLNNQADHLDDQTSFPGSKLTYGCGKSIENWAQAYLYAQKTGPGPVAFGSDLNGFAGQPYGRGKHPSDKKTCVGGKKSGWTLDPNTTVTYPFTGFGGAHFMRSTVGERPYDLDTDGFAHVGMYPDLVEGLRKLGLNDADLDPLMTSADGYVQMWERIDERP